MAARLEFFALDDDDRVARHVLSEHGTDIPVDLQLLGFVSADDEDEATLFALLGELAETGDLDPRTEGTGFVVSTDVPGLVTRLDRMRVEDVVSEPGEDLDMIVGWRDAIRASLTAATSAVGWRMRYDRAGTTNDGEDEFATGWSVDIA